MTNRVPCLVFSRVVGYLSPLNLWNLGKKQEFQDRKTYKVGLALDRAEERSAAPENEVAP